MQVEPEKVAVVVICRAEDLKILALISHGKSQEFLGIGKVS